MFNFKKKSRKLTAPKLSPDVLKNNGGYLPVPHLLINCAKCGLKPNHVLVLLYLLSKPEFTKDGEKWRVDYKHMADQLGIGETYAPKYITFLHEKGFISFNRNEKGETEWIITLPDYLVKTDDPEKNSESTPEPHRQNIHVDNIHVDNVAPLDINKYQETNKETTNAVVALEQSKPLDDLAKKPENNAITTATVAVEIEAKIPSTLSPSDKKAVKRELAKLSSAELQLNVLIVLTTAITKGAVKNAVGYTHALVKLALNGTLSTATAVDKPLSPLEKEKQAKQKLFAFLNRHLDALKRDFLELKKDYVYATGLGNITRDVFNEFLAVNGGAPC